MRLNQEELELLDELDREGIPLDEAVMAEMKAARRGLEIDQCGAYPQNAIFDLDSNGTAYMFDIAICNVSNRILWAHQVRLEIPWPESQFRWLENPLAKVPREYDYSFPSPGPVGFDPEVVLNDRLRHGCKLYPGDCLEGLLLGVGQASIPDHYVDRQGLRMRLSIYDEKGNRSSTNVILRVSREQKRGRQQAKESLRRGRELFRKHTQPGPARIRRVAA